MRPEFSDYYRAKYGADGNVRDYWQANTWSELLDLPPSCNPIPPEQVERFERSAVERSAFDPHAVTCHWCGSKFEAVRFSARFCDESCRGKSRRARARELAA